MHQTDTHPTDPQGRTYQHGPACAACTRPVPPAAAFCPWCGTGSGRQGTAPTQWDASGHQAPAGAGGGRRRSALIAIAAVTALALVAGALWLSLAPSAADRQLARSADALGALAEDLREASTTADIRGAADDASAPAREAEVFLEGLAADRRPEDLVLLSSALSAIASLSAVSGEDAQGWDRAAADLRSAGTADLPVEGLGSSVLAAADHAGRVIAEAQERFEQWQAEYAVAVSAREDAIASAQRYRAGMERAIDDYIDLRNSLSDYIDIVDTIGSTVEEGSYEFAAASAGRRAVRDDMASLDPPAAAASPHARLLSVMADGIAGVESAERALDSAECFWDICYVTDEPAWWNFRDESKRITAALDEAISDWESAVAAAIGDAEAMPLPARPQV